MKNNIIIVVVVITGVSIGTRALMNNKNEPTTQGREVVEVEKAEVIALSHNGSQVVPREVILKAGKEYSLEITPESNGKGCMSTIKREGTTSADAQLLIANETIRFSLPKETQPGTYKFVCNGMGMEQGKIIIEA